MEFSDHIVPTEARYSDISDAGSGNYAFIWDNEGRNISHPRDYFICGYDPETGQPAVPWLEEDYYQAWIESGMNIAEFLKRQPRFDTQSNQKRSAAELTQEGLVGLDCRYLNFAPQCDGWYNLTQHGGSGSFVIFWSGLKKLTTAAAIPYYTGNYGKSKRGFGFVTIGANVDEFHRAAVKTAEDLRRIQDDYAKQISDQNIANQKHLATSLKATSYRLTFYTLIMVGLVILIAVIMASTLTSTITGMIDGLKRFQSGDLSHRLKSKSKDEIGQLCHSFNTMAGTIKHLMNNIIDSMPSIFVGIDRDGNVTLWNQEAKRITGIEPNDAAGQSVFELLPLLLSKKERVLQAIEEGIIIKHEEYKTVLNQEIEFLDLTVYPLLIPHDPHGENNGHIRPPDTTKNERTRTADRELSHIKETEQIIAHKTDGAVIRVDNITARIQMEERIVQAEKMKSIGGLAAGMAHEINNPLAVITQNAQVIRNRMQDNLSRNISAAKACDITLEQLVEYCKKRGIFERLNDIMTASKRAADIVQNMLTFSRKSAPIFVACRLSDLLEKTINEMGQIHYELSKRSDFNRIKIIREYAPSVPSVKCDMGKMKQVFLNLLKNATQAIFENSESKERPYFILREYIKKQNVIIEIEDNGPGMDESTRKRIFEPFFTTKTVGMGTGLGLYVSYFIVHNEHNGNLEVASYPGKGTRFRITLPLSPTTLR